MMRHVREGTRTSVFDRIVPDFAVTLNAEARAKVAKREARELGGARSAGDVALAGLERLRLESSVDKAERRRSLRLKVLETDNTL